MTLVTDNFNRANGALGTSPTGYAWSVLAGTMTIVSNRAKHGSAARTIAVVDPGSGDVEAQADIGTNAGGYALYFRVSDANNWWRLAVNYYSYVSSYSTLYHHDEQCVLDADGVTYHWAYSSSYGGYPTSVPGHPEAGYHNNGYNNYTTEEPNYSNAYQLVLQKCVAGTVSHVAGSPKAIGANTYLRVVTSGSNIKAYCSSTGATAQFDITDAFNQAATKHGIGYYESSSIGNSDGLDNFTATTSGLYVPAVML